MNSLSQNCPLQFPLQHCYSITSKLTDWTQWHWRVSYQGFANWLQSDSRPCVPTPALGPGLWNPWHGGTFRQEQPKRWGFPSITPPVPSARSRVPSATCVTTSSLSIHWPTFHNLHTGGTADSHGSSRLDLLHLLPYRSLVTSSGGHRLKENNEIYNEIVNTLEM